MGELEMWIEDDMRRLSLQKEKEMSNTVIVRNCPTCSASALAIDPTLAEEVDNPPHTDGVVYRALRKRLSLKDSTLVHWYNFRYGIPYLWSTLQFKPKFWWSAFTVFLFIFWTLLYTVFVP